MDASTAPSSLDAAAPATPLYLKVVSVVVLIESILVLTFNPITLMAVIKSKMVQKSGAHFLIGALSVTDFLGGLQFFCLQVLRMFIIPRVGITQAVIQLNWFLCVMANMTVPASLNTSLLIGIDRFIAVSYPTRYPQKMKIRNAVIMVVCQWAWSILMVIPASIYKRIQEDHLKYIVMTPEAYPKGYTLYITTPLGFILLIANALLYARVFWLLKVQTNKVSNNTHQAISNRRSRRLTRMLLIVVCVLVGCWTPVTVLSSMAVTEGGLFVLNAYNITYAISFAVVMIPSFMNNIIYAWQHQDYRRAYLQLIRWNPQSDTD